MAPLTRAGLAQRPGIQQFIKFCIIGFSSALIDISISWALIYHSGLSHLPFGVILANILSFLVAVTNGFIWNSRWTFKGMGSGRRHELYVKFLLVNCIGLFLNLLIIKSVLFLFTGPTTSQTQPEQRHFMVAKLVAIGCVAIWNFMANKKWTFKHAPADAKSELLEQNKKPELSG